MHSQNGEIPHLFSRKMVLDQTANREDTPLAADVRNGEVNLTKIIFRIFSEG